MTEQHYLIEVRRSGSVVAQFIAAGPLPWYKAIGAWHVADEARRAAGKTQVQRLHYKVRSENDPEVQHLLAADEAPVIIS